MKKIQTNNIIFTDDQYQRVLMGEEFNFALDKISNVSACWGKTINDTPEYDPVSPQELIFKISNFSLEKYLNNFNFLANIKIKKSKTEFENIENPIEALTLENLTCLSTLASVVLIFDNLKDFNMNNMLKFSKYIRKFKVQLIIQINAEYELSYEELMQLKLLGTSIQIKTDENFNAEIFLTNLNNLIASNILVSSKISVTKNSFNEIMKVIPKLPKNTSMKLFFIKPYITINQYKKIQQEFINANLLNVRIATCSNSYFNKRSKNIILIPMDCDSTRFSIYIEDDSIYPCEYLKKFKISLNKCKNIHDFWYNKNIIKLREKIAEFNYCK